MGTSWRPGLLPSLKDNHAHLFLAHGVRETAAPDPDEHELVEVVKVPVGGMWDLIQAGEIVSSSGVAAVMLAIRRLERKEPGVGSPGPR